MKLVFNLFISFLIVSFAVPVLANETIDSEIEQNAFDEFGIQNHELIQNEVHNNTEHLTLMALSTPTWETMSPKSNVDLNKEWTIKFSGSPVSLDKIAGIVIEREGVFIPVRIRLFPTANEAIVTPQENYLANETYTMRVFLENGLRYKMKFTTKAEVTNARKYGNSSGNIVNKGIVAEAGGWIYYSNSADNNYLYKTNGADNIKLSDRKAHYINVLGGWVYFRNGNSLYRIRTDGTELTSLSGVYGYVMVGDDGWIYFQSNSSWDISRKSLEGKNHQTLLSAGYSVNPIIDNNTIYYTYGSSSENTKLSKYNLINKANNQLTDEDVSHVNVTDNWIYYINLEKQKIYKIDKDGQLKSELISDWAESLNVYKDYAYYVNSEDRYIYRVKLDGTGKQQINQSPSTNINIISDWIYYEDPTTNEYYRMKHNGSNWQNIQ